MHVYRSDEQDPVWSWFIYKQRNMHIPRVYVTLLKCLLLLSFKVNLDWRDWYFTFRIMVGMAQRWNSFGNWWERKKTCLWLVWKSCKRLSMWVHMYMLNSYRGIDFSFTHILWYTGMSSRYDSNIKLYFVIFSCRCLVGVRTVLYWRNGTDWWDIPHSWCFWAGFGDCWTPCGSGFQFMGGI